MNSEKLSGLEIQSRLRSYLNEIRDSHLAMGRSVMYADYGDNFGFIYLLFPFGEKVFVKWIEPQFYCNKRKCEL